MALLDKFTVKFNFQTDAAKLARMERSVEKLRSGLNALSTAAGALGTALTAAAGFTVKQFADVESQFAIIEGLVGISREQLDAWGEDLNRLAHQYGKAPDELADALFDITSAGYRGAEAMEVLEFAAKGSAAGLGDVKTISDLLTSVLDVYKDGTLDAAGAMDILTAAIREGKLEPASLAGALSLVLPFAAAANVGFGEVAGAMAVMSKQGIKANQSATALRGIFNKLIKPTKQGEQALKNVGYSMEDIHKIIEEEGLIQALRTMRKAFGENDKEIAKVFEDTEGLLGVLVLTNENAAENAELMMRVAEATGDLDLAFRAVTHTLKFRFSQVMSLLKVQLIDMGARVAPMAHKFINLAESVLLWYQNLGKAPQTMAEFLAMGEKANSWFVQHGEILKDVIAQALSFGPVLLGVSAAAAGLSLALKVLAPLLKPLMAAFALVAANPILAAIAAVIAGLVLAVTYWEEVVAFAKRAGEFLKQAWEKAKSAFLAVDWESLGHKAARLINAGIKSTTSLWNKISDGMEAIDWASLGHKVGELIRDGIKSIFSATTSLWNKLSDGMEAIDWASLGHKVGELIRDGIKSIFSAAASIWSGVGDAVAGGIFGAIKAIFAGGDTQFIADWMNSALDVMWGVIPASAEFIGGAIFGLLGIPDVTVFNWIGDSIRSAVDSVREWIGDRLKSILSYSGRNPFLWIVGFWREIINVILGLIPETWFPVPDVNPFGWIAEKFEEAVSGLWELVPERVRRLLSGDWVEGTWLGAVGDAAGGAKDAVVDKTRDAMGRVRDLLPGSDAKEGPLSDLTESGRSLMRTLAQGVAEESRHLADVLAAGLPVGPPITALQTLEAENRAPVARGDRPINISIDRIEIMAPGGDPKDIAAKTAGQLRDQIRRAVESADSQVLV